MNILVSAYACDPDRGSEAGAGWRWARAAAQGGNRVWILTRAKHRPAIDAAAAAEGIDGIEVVPLELGRTALRLKRLPGGTYGYYLVWQARARRVALEACARHGIDVVHHLTFAADWLPAGVLAVPGVASVWGPVGGSAEVRLLRQDLGARGTVAEVVRDGLTRAAASSAGQLCASRADLMVAANAGVARRYAPIASVVVEPNCAITADEVVERPSAGDDRPRTAVFVGRLLPFKGLTIALRAIADAGDDWHLEVLGEGPDRERCEALAGRLGLGARVRFRGRVPRHEALAAIASADVLLAPSSHESSGWAVAEAVTIGTPVVALGVGGHAEILGHGGGVLVEPGPEAATAIAGVLRDGRFEDVAPAPAGRWGADRLPRMLNEWYAYAHLARHGPDRAAASAPAP